MYHASTKIAEGDYGDCLKMLMTDIEEEKKYKGLRGYSVDYTAAKTYKSDRPVVYLAGPERYDKDAKELYKKRKELCASYGLQAFTPADCRRRGKNGYGLPYTAAANQFDSWQQHVRNCDAIIADLNDYRGYECSNDVALSAEWPFS